MTRAVSRPSRRPESAEDLAGAALLVYGTLSWPVVTTALLGRELAHSRATLEGWRAAPIRDQVYPGLLPAPGRRVDGQLVEGLEAADWLLVDDYEDDWYDLRLLTTTDGRRGWCYVCGPGAPVAPGDWDREAFAAAHLGSYVERCATWRERHLQAGT